MANQTLAEFTEKTFVADADWTFVWDTAGAISKKVSRNSLLNSGTLATSAPVTISQTWNDAAVAFTALKVNATSTNSAAGSLLLDLQVGGSPKFNVSKASVATLGVSAGADNSALYFGGVNYSVSLTRGATSLDAGVNGDNRISLNVGGGYILLSGRSALAWSDGVALNTATIDTYLYRDAANTLALRNSTAAQTFNVYGTYTSASVYARLAIACDTSGNATLTTQSSGVAGTVSINGVPVGLGKGNVSSNVAIGSSALNANTTGSNNLALGANTLFHSTTATFNSALGENALRETTTGSFNVALGASAMQLNSTGASNTAVGVAAGAYAFNGGTSVNNTTSSFSVFLGRDTKPDNIGQTNQIVIGYNTNGLGSNSVVLGNASITTTALRGNVGIGTTAPSSKLHVVGDAVLTGDLLGTNYTIGVPTTLTQSNISITNTHSGVADSAVVITPKGTGGVIFGPKPDGTLTGGNARGARAIDHQLSRNAAAQVASGTDALICGGNNNTASNQLSIVVGGASNASTGYISFIGGGQLNTSSSNYSTVAGGNSNTASATWSTVAGGQSNTASGSHSFLGGGFQGLANRFAISAHAAGQFSALGDAQTTKAVFRNKTTTNSAVELFLDGASARYTVTSGKVISMLINITGTKSDGTAVAHYVRQYSIKNLGGTTSQVYAPVTIGTDNAAGTSIALSADDTNDSLKIEVTGVTSETWRWVASVDAVEVGYGV
jgi:hypothetical protein